MHCSPAPNAERTGAPHEAINPTAGNQALLSRARVSTVLWMGLWPETAATRKGYATHAVPPSIPRLPLAVDAHTASMFNAEPVEEYGGTT